ncbi:ABC transporter ATP-binding protein [Corynebacterium tapiri]|uniref:ABC transporter ATP-binding protein n=1 Tax=Corynebacterium tapiri TaxID=1448266 RepID=A0A5C4U2R2_9CORY|nr:ABC transporter ATP-binding protein [Corynebacterium tapiri]TNL95695.1 ABC transporter ATP-binding protein [Corynebacterium tapiri]
MDLLKLLAHNARPYRLAIVAVIVLQAASTAATLYLPSLNARIIDQGVAKGDVPYIWSVGGVMLAVAFAQVITACAAIWFGSRAAMGTGRDIRSRVFNRVARFSVEDVSHYGASTLITRGTNDVQQVQMVFLMFLNFMVAAPIMMVGGIIMALREDPGMSWLVLVSVLVLGVVVGLLIMRLLPKFQAMQTKIDRVNGVLREQITGIRVVRAFTREEHESKRFRAANTELTDLSRAIGNLFVLLFPLILVILNVSIAALLWFGGHRVDNGDVEVGSLTAFMQYLMQILAAVMMGAFMAMMLPRAMVCAQRITEVLSHSPSIVEPTEPAGQVAGPATVAFDDVTFSYPGAEAPVLDSISFHARPGTVTAIIGSTGSGKTTLAGLVPRLMVPSSGRVSIGGADITELTRDQITKLVSVVPQKPYLFSGTVASNLRVANASASEEQLWDALRIAQADFVDDLEMPISQGGTNVSGGQRQRLCIARALVSQARVYVFDDSFSALDMVTESQLRTALAPRMKDATMIVVAQRVSSIQDADNIIVLDAGKIVASGTHDELVNSSETYREIAESQMMEDAR